jgi:Rod binding domain-containing protein
MSSLAPVTSTGLPIVDEAHAPAYVRAGSAAVKQDYATAQGFEEMLLQQLSQSLAQSSGLSGESESSGEEGSSEGSGEGGSGMLASLLPQTLTEGVMRDGGLGLATQMMHTLDPSAAGGSLGGALASTGGASAPAGTAPAPSSSAGTANGVIAQTGGVSA